MGDYRYCTACLATDVKMHNFNAKISTMTIGQMFSSIVRTPDLDTEGHICFECAGLVYKCVVFQRKCLRAQDILSAIKKNHHNITKTYLQNVNRVQNRLISNLGTKCTENYSNETPIITEETTFTNEIKPHIQCDIDMLEVDVIKNEPISDEHEVNSYEHEFSQIDDYSNDITESISKKTKHKIKKAHKTRVKSIEIPNGTEIFESPSDDEPLSNKVSKIENELPIIDNNEIEVDGATKKKHPRIFDSAYFENYATVVFLTAEEAKKELLLRKESSNYINSPFQCQLCYRGYEAKVAFENHMKKHSEDYGNHACDICHLRFPEQRCLCKHRLASHKRKFYCKLCPYVCFCTHQAKTHVSLHKGKKYPCEECGEIFSMPNSLLMHKRLKHVTECVCELCGNTFATPRGLYSHNVKIHRQDKNEKLGPKCEQCNKHFATEEAWKRHLVLSSKHNVSNGCKYCGDTFQSTEELKSHMRVHARKHANRGDNVKLPSACSICAKWIEDRSEYKAHMTSAHPHTNVAKKLDADGETPFVCEVCGQMFKMQCFLTYHQRKHTGERPYRCAQCGKTFPLAGALATHRAVHRRRTHACRVCDRLFTFKSALNKHMKVHLGIRPHRCDICNKSFISPCDVKIHIKYVHNKVPWPKRDRAKRNQEQSFTQY